ncbi:MAG: colanic acid/amylovoran biosynthesis protein [Candidatus Nitrosomirales archaeon]
MKSSTLFNNETVDVKRIAAFGYYGRGNIGDEIFLRTLQDNRHDIRFEGVLNASKSSTRLSRFALAADDYIKRKTKLDVSLSDYGRLLPIQLRTRHLENILQNFDSVLLGPGGFVWLSRFHPWFDALYRVLSQRKLPFHCYGLGVDPANLNGESGHFENKIVEKWTKLLRLSDTIYVRDHFSKDLLQRNAIHEHVVVVNDIAFAYPLPPPASKTQEKIVGINLRTKFVKESEIFNDKQQLLGIIEFFVGLGYKIVLIPFQNRGSNNGTENDNIVMKEILRLTKHKASIRILKGASPNETIRHISCLDFFIGTRYHSVLFALRYGIPTCAIAYRPKVRSLMEEYYDLGEYVVKPDQVSMIKELFMDREKMRSKAVAKTSDIERTTMEQVDCFLSSLLSY